MDSIDFPVVISGVNAGTVFVFGEPGTNFGWRIDAETAAALLRAWPASIDNPVNGSINIMAAGYGDDSDWVGLSADDLDEEDNTMLKDPEGWAPFELTIGPMTDPSADQIAHAVMRGYYITEPAFTTMSMRDLVEAHQRLGTIPETFDYALPQHWVDDVFERTGLYPYGFVWVYPPKSIFGEPFAVTPAAVKTLEAYEEVTR